MAGLASRGDYITYDENTHKFSLSAEQAFTLANEDSPASVPGAFELALGSLAAVPTMPTGFVPVPEWAGMNTRMGSTTGVRSSSAPGYAANLVSSWIPALEGVKEKLE